MDGVETTALDYAFWTMLIVASFAVFLIVAIVVIAFNIRQQAAERRAALELANARFAADAMAEGNLRRTDLEQERRRVDQTAIVARNARDGEHASGTHEHAGDDR